MLFGETMMVRRWLISGLPMAAATLFSCWNPAVAQSPMPPCLAVGTSTPPTCGSSTTSGPASDAFPRTAIMAYGGNVNILYSGNTNAGLPFATVAAQSSIVVPGVYLGVESMGTYSSLMQGWEAGAQANGLTLRTFVYTGGQAPQYTNANYPWLTAALNASSMWAYTSASGSGTTNLLPYGGSGNTGQSYLQITPSNTQTVSSSFTFNGKTGVLAGSGVWNLFAQYFYDVFVNGLAISKYGESAGLAPNPNLAGIFYDNETPSPPGTATWNGLGTAPTAGTAAAIQQGQAKQANALRALNPKMLVAANSFVFAGTVVDPSYVGVWDIDFVEEVIGQSYSIESGDNSPPGHFMQDLIATEQEVSSSGTLIFHQTGTPGGGNGLTGNQSTWNSTQWRYVRYGFAAAMQRNWHYALNCGLQGYSSFGLMDEQVQTANGTANYGWLSAGTQRLDPPQSGAWTQGVWRRRFPNGWVLWNPRGNGAQTVTIPSTLCRIHTRGYGDSNVNTGACGATTVTLQDADGLFLIGTG
jgi:hypothetical protein